MPVKTAARKATNHAIGSDVIDNNVALRVLGAVQRGDFPARMPTEWSGSAGKVAAAFNSIIEANERLEREIRRLSRQVGNEGQTSRGASRRGAGAWASTLDAVNDLAED